VSESNQKLSKALLVTGGVITAGEVIHQAIESVKNRKTEKEIIRILDEYNNAL
jgi:hypothetical protein